MSFEEIQVERNLKGIELEKAGKVNAAIKLYEQNVKESFDGSHPYTRLSVIYRKRKMLDDEIRVLKKAIWVYRTKVYKGREDILPKSEKFHERLKKAKKLKQTLEVK